MDRESTAGVDGPTVPVSRTLNAATMATKIYLALPWQKMTNPMTAFCVMALSSRRKMVSCLNFGDAFVAHSRNTTVDLFLASDCDWMLMIDDDMLVPFGNAEWFNAHAGTNFPDQWAGVNAIERLLSHGKTLVGALYFGRHPHGAPMYSEGANVPTEGDYCRKAPMDVLKPTRWVATGCLLVHRKVFLDIEKRYPRLARNHTGKRGHWFSSSEHQIMDTVDRARAVLSDGREMTGEKALKAFHILEEGAATARSQSTLGVGEDVQFCLRAKEAGHQPYVDLGLVCGHIGQAVYGPWNTRRKP